MLGQSEGSAFARRRRESGRTEQLREVVATLAELSRDLTATTDRLATALSRAAIPRGHTPPRPAAIPPRPQPRPGHGDATAVNTVPGSSPIPLGKAEREIHRACPARHPLDHAGGVLTRRSHKSGGFRNSLSKLRTAELITGRGEVTITDAGRRALGTWEALPAKDPS